MRSVSIEVGNTSSAAMIADSPPAENATISTAGMEGKIHGSRSSLVFGTTMVLPTTSLSAMMDPSIKMVSGSNDNIGLANVIFMVSHTSLDRENRVAIQQIPVCAKEMHHTRSTIIPSML